MIGGGTSLTAAWLTQSHQATAERLTQEKSRRQKLYKEFIEEASKLYADALSAECAFCPVSKPSKKQTESSE
jgi:hypothetical protein